MMAAPKNCNLAARVIPRLEGPTEQKALLVPAAPSEAHLATLSETASYLGAVEAPGGHLAGRGSSTHWLLERRRVNVKEEVH